MRKMKDVKIVKYEHHGKTMSVIESMKDKHADHCLCWQSCVFFKPNNVSENCEIAQELFEFNKSKGVITPVWECFKYDKKEE